jgi:hypothetical protein
MSQKVTMMHEEDKKDQEKQNSEIYFVGRNSANK